MLKRLFVENYALIDSLEIEPGDNLNIITGETGAGKSILLGALSLMLGSKADVNALKDAAKSCVVEAEFAIAGYSLKSLFEQNDIDYEDTIVVRRVISPQGKSRTFINELPVQTAALKDVVGSLIDIHSQHQSLMVARESFRIDVVDSVAENAALLGHYAKAYEALRAATKELEAMQAQAAESHRDEEYIRHQHEQLMHAKLRPSEQTEAENEVNILSNAEQITQALASAAGALDNDEDGIILRLKGIEGAMQKIDSVYREAGVIATRIHSVYVELKDIFETIDDSLQSVEADPAKLEFLSERLNTIYTLEQKHGVKSVDELITLRDGFAERLTQLSNYDSAIEELTVRISQLEADAIALAAKITQSRKAAAAKVEKYVGALLERLAMAGAVLNVEITPAEKLGATGADKINFNFSANKNIAAQPLEKVASGGEISRVMLAIKSLVARSSKLPTIIFDEIDTGVSGRIADAMGEIIVEMSRSMQVINITHLPQVASKGDYHFVVYKENSTTNLRRVEGDQRIEEIAKMLSGSNITDAAIAQAKILLAK